VRESRKGTGNPVFSIEEREGRVRDTSRMHKKSQDEFKFRKQARNGCRPHGNPAGPRRPLADR
jgi:hypothetical protein